MNLGELWRARRWRFLLNLIDHLPRDSHYVEAAAQDDELAAYRRTPSGKAEMRVAEWSPEVAVLASVHDIVAQLLAVTYAANGNKPPKISPYPRPMTAQQRLEAVELRRKQDAVRQMLYPPRGD